MPPGRRFSAETRQLHARLTTCQVACYFDMIDICFAIEMHIVAQWGLGSWFKPYACWPDRICFTMEKDSCGMQTTSITRSEELAANAQDCSVFVGFSLSNVRTELVQILQQIGRDGIFREYTLHD